MPKTAIIPKSSLTNSDLAELLARESETAQMPAQKALRRASRRALFWSEEAADLLKQGRELTELSAVGPYLKKLIEGWIEDPPAIPERPAIRHGFLTLTEARAVLSSKPSWLRGIKGDLQMHTNWSDGEGTIEEMANAAIARKYEYIAITDHAKGLKIAGGIDEKQVCRQAVEIETTNEKLRADGHEFSVLHSIELNLNPRGEGDMDERCLGELDLVLGCFHSSLRIKEDQTERYLAALRNPSIQILGHPRGRIYNYRLGLTADWSRVFECAAQLDKAVEIDGYPDRPDLNVNLLRLAKEAGCRISLGTDSHGPTQLGFMEYSAAAALMAGIPRSRILNFMSTEEVTSWAASVRSGRKVNALFTSARRAPKNSLRATSCE
jgi:histidinol phosphatase-like PHP family hydrolase